MLARAGGGPGNEEVGAYLIEPVSELLRVEIEMANRVLGAKGRIIGHAPR